MDGSILLLGLLLALFLGFSAFFSGSEAALFSLTRSDVARIGRESPSGRQVQSLLQEPRRVLITILIGNLVVNVLSTSIFTGILVSYLGSSGVAVSFVLMSVLILLFGEILPKVVAIHHSRRFSLLCVFPLRFFHVVLAPARIPITRFTDAVIEALKKRLGSVRRYFSKEELLTALDLSHRDGELGKFEHELIANVIEFRDTVVREIMTPSIHVFSLPMDMSREELEERIIEREVSRVPVYGETTDDIRGILHIKDLITTPRETEFEIEKLLRPAHYVPESTRIAELFETLAKRHTQLVLVMDEYGSFVGIATMEDILEELVGEIRDAGEPLTADYTRLDENRIVVQGTMEIDDFNHVFGTDIQDDEHDTIAGYVIGFTGTIPKEGQTIEIGYLKFHVISAQPNRIRKMRVERP